MYVLLNAPQDLTARAEEENTTYTIYYYAVCINNRLYACFWFFFSSTFSFSFWKSKYSFFF